MDKNFIEEVAWIGKEYVKGNVKGVILNFHGLGGGLKNAPTTEELEWGRHGGLVVYPYYGPWAWMNRQARSMVDELVDAIYEAYGLAETVPLICVGGSMGGQGSLLYTRYAKRPIRACLANCPVCDLHYHFHERPDLPPTIRCAFQGYPEPLEQVISEHSPLHEVAAMPDVPYRIIHGDNDQLVSKQHHSDKLVPAMVAQQLQVEYVEVPGMGHGGPTPFHVLEGNINFVTSFLS